VEPPPVVPPSAPPPVVPPSAPPPAPAAPAPAEPQTVEVTVETTPAGALVLHGGALLGKTPFHGTLPRSHDASLVLRLAGYVVRAIVVHPDRPVTEHVQLVRTPPRAPPKSSRDQSVNPFAN